MENPDDDDLKRAIALSLSEQNTEDEELQRAITLSLESKAQAAAAVLRRTDMASDDEDEDIRRAIALSLNKPMEALTAREALGLTPAAEEARNKRILKRAGEAARSNKRMRTEQAADDFWEGAVKLTHVDGYSGPNFIRIEDIIRKDKLKKAVMTAFMVSQDFIQDQIPEHVNLCIVMHGRPAMARQISPTRTYIIPPLKDSKFGVFHPKLMILVHESSLRIVIGSANLERYDYHDLENVVFIQDFKLLVTPAADLDMPEFGKHLCDLLDAMGVPPSVKAELHKYDFSTAKARLVASVSGDFEGDDEYKRYGHVRLAHIVREMMGSEQEPTRVEMQTSSLGGLTSTYLHELYRSFSGKDPYANGERPARLQNPKHCRRLTWYSRRQIQSEIVGWGLRYFERAGGAGTICLNTTSWRKATFPKQVMCDAISIRPGTLMHSKYIIGTLSSLSTRALKGWVYCGSHNATMSAWGKLSLSKTSKKPKMSMSNWELGVILPIYEDSQIPVTYRRPPPRYKPDQEPWTQDMLFSS